MDQDWDTVQWRKETKRQQDVKRAQLNNSIRTRQQAKNVMLDTATDAGKIEKISKGVAQKLMQGRLAKKLKQSDLAAQLSLPVKTIQDIEGGKYKKDNQLFQKIARKLGIKL